LTERTGEREREGERGREREREGERGRERRTIHSHNRNLDI
jgi:hypothetical protein